MVLSVSVDLSDCTRARTDMPLIADLETMVPHLKRNIDDIPPGRRPRARVRSRGQPPDDSARHDPTAAEPRRRLPVIRWERTSHEPPAPLAIDGR
jgi:hypothetical protein